MRELNNRIILFTDGSVNTKTKVGVGAYLLVNPDKLSNSTFNDVTTVSFNNTSSTKLEIEVLLFALNQFNENHIDVYTDSQNLVGLPNRRNKLESTNFLSKSGKEHQFKTLYQELFAQIDKRDIVIKKLKGHSKKSEKDQLDHLFTLVDRASRKALRNVKI